MISPVYPIGDPIVLERIAAATRVLIALGYGAFQEDQFNEDGSTCSKMRRPTFTEGKHLGALGVGLFVVWLHCLRSPPAPFLVKALF